MRREDFEDLVVQALEELPEYFKKKLENIEVVVETRPTSEVLKKLQIGHPRLLLGLYQGVPLKRRGIRYGSVLPDKVTLYQEPIESVCNSEEEIEERVREVVKHEIGHYFGLSEDELQGLEIG